MSALATLGLTAALIGIVSADQVPLRAAPRDSAPQQALLWQGEALEIRGHASDAGRDFVQVYDHRRERGGYLRASQFRAVALDENAAGTLKATWLFLRDMPGMETQGVAYVAAYLKAAPANAIDAEPFDALGTMAERLARRASQARGNPPDAALAAHLEVAASYGVTMKSFERADSGPAGARPRMQLCYEGDAFRRVMTLPATAAMRARAALALTRHDCIDPALPLAARLDIDSWRAQILDGVDADSLPEAQRNRLHLRRAGVWAGLAHHAARRGDSAQAAQVAQAAGRTALDALAAVNRIELAPDDAWSYADAAARVGASRWAAEAEAESKSALRVDTAPGEPGQTCVKLIDTRGKPARTLIERCTHGVVWAASARANAAGTALALAVQPLAAWRELWLFHQTPRGWRLDVLPPATDDIDVGYLEFAGWVQDAPPARPRVLAVRESRTSGRYRRSFEVIRLDSLQVEKRADAPQSIKVFNRWQSAEWKRSTLSLR